MQSKRLDSLHAVAGQGRIRGRIRLFLALTALAVLSFPLQAAEEAAAANAASAGESPAAVTDSAVASPENVATDATPVTGAEASTSPVDSGRPSLFLTAGPLLLVNSHKESAPSPILFSCGLGMSLFEDKPLLFQPRLSFFATYYLWDSDAAHPAEIENRTAQVFSALLDLCAVKSWQKGSQSFQLGAGSGILARFAVAAGDVSDDDAGDDVKKIQSWLWSDLRWLYPEVSFSWLHALPEKRSSAGLEARFYLPLASLIAGNGMDASILSLSCKLNLAL